MVQYVTTSPYLCNSVIPFERLHTLGSKADRLLMYPSHMNPDGKSVDSKLLRKACDDMVRDWNPLKSSAEIHYTASEAQS